MGHLAEIYGTSVAKIRRLLKKHGVRIRTVMESAPLKRWHTSWISGHHIYEWRERFGDPSLTWRQIRERVEGS
jgi:hypothetical protein